jgi:hypothetical protein
MTRDEERLLKPGDRVSVGRGAVIKFGTVGKRPPNYLHDERHYIKFDNRSDGWISADELNLVRF